MRAALFLSLAVGVSGLAGSAHAADAEAGRALAMPCTACHGQNGVSVSPTIPNLAGQKPAYIINQLKAFRAGSRKNELMNAIAAQLNDQQIENLAAFWSSLPGAATAATSPIPPHIERTRVKFPENYQRDFVHYHTISFPDRGQVRKYYANRIAIEAAREGRPMPDGAYFFVEVFSARLDDQKKPIKGPDGNFVEDRLLFYTAMETQSGWGNDFPDLLRNGDWNYAVFLTDKTVRPGVNQAECLACHKPVAKDSYVFTLKTLQAKAQAMR